MVQNIDIAPTILHAMGVYAPEGDAHGFDGRSASWALLRGEDVAWRDHILYEYHWEWNFPATPTTLAIRDSRYKYIYYHGIWDRDGFYDLATDPHERHNLIDVPGFADHATRMRQQLFDELDASGGLVLPIRPPRGEPYHDRKLRR